LVKEVLEELLLSEEEKEPPCGGDEVPTGDSSGDDGASECVHALDHVFGKVCREHLETDVDTTTGNGDSLSNEFLETGIGVWDGNTDTFVNNGRAALEVHGLFKS
jgi:hypothetical protein